MGLQETHKALKNNLTGKRLVLGKKTLAVEKIDETFEQVLGERQLEVKDVQSVDLGAQTITFSGKTSVYDIPDLNVSAKISEAGGKQQIVLSADLLSNWNFTAAKPQYPPNVETVPDLVDKPFLSAIFQQLTREKPRLVFSSYAHQNGDLGFALEKGSNLVWTYVPDNGAPISLGGPVKLEDGKLVCSLALPYTMKLGPNTLDQIEVFFDLGRTGAFAPSQYGLKGRLSVGALKFDLKGIADIYDLDIEFSAESQELALNGFQALKDFTGILDVGRKLSQDFKDLPGLKLTRAAVRFNPVHQKVLRAAVRVETTKAWKVLPQFTVNGIILDAAIEEPFDAASRDITGRLTGKIKVAGVDVTVRAFFPDPVAIGEMDEDQNVTLRKLLSQYASGVADVPALKITRMSALADPAGQRFLIGATAEGDWKFSAGAGEIRAKELSCDVLSAGGSVSGEVRGIFGLAGNDFMLSAAFPDLEFSAGAVDARPLSLKALVTEFAGGAVALPPLLPDLLVADAALHGKPATGEFEMSARCLAPWALSLGGVDVTLREIDWHMERAKASGGALAWTAGMTGRLKLAGLDFGVTVEKYAAASDAWRMAATLAQDKPLKLADFLKDFLPAAASLPANVGSLMIKKSRVSLDFKISALTVEAETAGTLGFGGIGSVEARGLSFQIAPRTGARNKSDWRLKLIGGLKMGTGYELAGSLDCFDEAAGAGFAFVPTAQTPLTLPLPFPKRKNKPVSVNIEFGAIAITEAAGKFTFDSAVTVGFDNLPDFFDRLIAGRSTASLKATKDAVTLNVDRIFEGIEVPLPAITAPNSRQIDLGKMRFEITDLCLEVGDEASFSAKFGVGIPEKLNNLFGVKANGKPQIELFRTYDPRRPVETLTRSMLTAGTAGVSFTLVDSPLKAVTFTQQGGKTWCACDFGELGAVKFMLPILSLDVATTSFKGAGAMEVTRPIRLPLALVKNLLASNGQQAVAGLLPESIPLKAIKLLDAQNNIDVDKMAAHLEASSAGAVKVPKAVKDTFKLFSGMFNKLPDRFRGYFDISLPNAFDFDISVMPDGGVCVNITVGGAPIKAFFCNPPQPTLFGIELRGFSFGEVLGGNLFLVKADVIVDMFDPSTLAAMFIPNVPFLADSRALQQSFIFRKLTMLVVYQTAIPIPIPLFYDEIGYEYHGIEDGVFQTHVKFPMPALNPMEIIRIFGEFQKFASDKNYLMDTRNPPRNVDLKFTLGANYIQLPKYLGSAVLGKKTDIGTISLYQTVAGLLNGMKTFSVNRLIQVVPIQERVGTQDVEFLGMKFRSQWLVTTPQEFADGAYTKLNLNAAAKQELTALVPRPAAAAAPPEGIAVFLQGSGAVAGAANWTGRFALAVVDGTGCATGFRLAGNFVDGLIGMDLSGMVKMNVKSPAPFELKGAGEVRFLGEKAMAAEIGYGADGLTVKGFLDLFPTTSLLQVEGSVAGALKKDSFLMEGDVRFGIGQHFVLSGAHAKLTQSEFAVRGTWMGQSLELGMTRQATGVRFSAGMSPLAAAGNLFKITGPGPLGGPSLAIDARQGAVPECTIAGTASLLGMTGQTQMRLTPQGASFHVTGKAFNLYQAALDVTTSIDLLKTDAIHVTASLQPDFFGAAQAGVVSGLRDASRQADARVNAVKARMDQAKRELDATLAQLDAMTRQIQNELNVRANQARSQVTAAQNAANQARTAVNQTRARVNADKAAADRALDDAQDKVDGLKDDIDDIKDDLKKWRKRLADCKPWEVDKIADLGLKIADGELKKAGLEAAKSAATLAVNAARAAVDTAAAAVNAALAGVNQQLAAANRALADAKARLSDIQRQLQQIGDDIRLHGVKAARDAKNAVFEQAKHELDQARLREKALLDLGAAIAGGAPVNVFEVTSATFSGFLNVLHGGQVTLTVTVRVMRGAPRTLAVPFDFANPAAGMAAIFTEVQKLI